MNLLNIKKLAAALTVACSLVFASSASAAVIDLLTASDSPYYLGSFTPNTPSSPDDEEDYIDILAGLAASSTTPVDGKTYTRSANNFGSDLGDADFSWKNENEVNDVNEFILASTYLFVLGKYGTTSHVWYIDDLVVGDKIVLPSRALSHTSFFGGTTTTVPDSASTLLLIGLGLAGLGFVARRRKA